MSLLLAAASAANTQYGGTKALCENDAVVDGYGGEGGTLAHLSCPGDGRHDILGLPLTGLDLLLIVVGGLALILVGLTLRHYNSYRDNAATKPQ